MGDITNIEKKGLPLAILFKLDNIYGWIY